MDPRKEKHAIGTLGEDYAAAYLQALGYEIIDNNFRIRGGEIDLVARIPKDEYGLKEEPPALLFIEVKTRTSETHGKGEDSFRWKKRVSFRRAIQAYLTKHFLEQGKLIPSYRKDFVDVTLGEKEEVSDIVHYEDV